MKLLLTTTAFLVGATGAMAQGLTGATVGFDYLTYPDVDDSSTTRFYGSAEFEVASGFFIAADFSSRSYDAIDEDASNVILHAIYAVSPDLSVGAFVGRESLDDIDIDNYGAEIAYTSGPASVEAYLGSGEVEYLDLTYLGVLGGYGLGNGFSVIGGIERVGIETGSSDGSFTMLEIGGEYEFAGGGTIFAKAGQLSPDTDFPADDENYFEIGASFSFGSNGGTTFSTKGLLDIVPASAL